MKYLSAKSLRELLRTHSLSQADELNCFLIGSSLSINYLYIYGYLGMRLDGYAALAFICAVGLNFLGACLAYEANGREEGRDFFCRLLVLSVTLNIAGLAIQMTFTGIAWFAFPHFHSFIKFSDPTWAWQLTMLLIFNVSVIWVWWRIRFHIFHLTQN